MGDQDSRIDKVELAPLAKPVIKKRKKGKRSKKKKHIDLMNVALKSTNQSKGMMILEDEECSSSSSMNFGDNSLNSLSRSIMQNPSFHMEDDDDHRLPLNNVGPLTSHNTDVSPMSDSNEKLTNN